MSHHFDSPTAIADGRLNLCDLYAFPGRPGSSVFVLTVNPDAGRSSPTTLRPGAVYEVLLAPEGSTTEVVAYRVRTVPGSTGDDADGATIEVRRADGGESRSGTDGTVLGTGPTGDVLELGDGGRVWVGEAADPFWADGAALAGFLQAVGDGRYDPGVFVTPGNLFEGRNVTAVVLEVPDDRLRLGASEGLWVWGRVALHGHGPQIPVSRIGQAMLRPLFFPVPGPDTEALNAGTPDADRREHGAHVTGAATAVARLAGHPDPDGHARRIADAFLPDVLAYRPGAPAAFAPGTGNGRALTDDAFGTALSLLVGGDLGRSVAPFTPAAAFPHVLPPHRGDLPALADLFGLRPGGS